jgi:hypothetical protein
LRFTFEEKTADATVYDYSGNGTQVSKWTTIPANEAAFTKTYTVTIELPLGTENEYKNKTCSLSYVVEAIQGNAAIPQEASVTVGDTTTDYESLAEAIVEAAKYENSIVKPLTTVSYSVVIPANNGLTLDLNGADVSVVGASKSFTVKNSSATQSTLTLQNVTINGNEELNNKSALTVESGDVKLNALGVNKFYGVKGGNGIEIAKTATVNITGDTIQAYGNGGYEYAYVTNTYKGVTTTGE